MKRLALCLLPLTLSAGQARYARVSDFDGAVEVQLQAADDWQAARRNLPLRELSWLRTDGPARVEVELDDGNVLRVGPESLVEFSDYTRLSSGQRITVISLDHGVAYFTGAAESPDTVILALPGAQASVRQPVRLRLEARDPWSMIATTDGSARFSSPAAEFDLGAGQIVKIDPSHTARFYLYREIPTLETDRWSDERDKVLASTTSAAHVPGLRYGLADLDANGVWIQTGELGTVWKPKMPAAWTPFRRGKWNWYDGLGYTWMSDEPWGWLPYHYGRWMFVEGMGWVWSPGENTVFMPGEVYWLKGAKLVGWGALAPGENWKPPATPQLFLNANTTYATYAPDTHEIDPAGFAERPREPMPTAVFVEALPSPPFPAARLDAFRPPLRAGSTSGVAVASAVAFGGQPDPPPPAPQQQQTPAPVESDYIPPAQSPVMIVNAPPVEVPVEVDVPVYLGIVVVNPPGYKAPVTSPTAQKPPKSVPAPGSGSTPTPQPKPKTPDPDKPVK
jgi:hypothetical protein